MQKKQSIQQFEKILLKDSDYKHFIDVVKEDDKSLSEISQKFHDLSIEAKRILDEISAKSDKRKEQHGVYDDDDQSQNHHKPLP